MSILTFSHALLAAVALAAPAVAAPMDWRATLAADARAFHAEQAANHPGPHNPADPDFSTRLDASLSRALARAETVSTPGGYLAAMREMVAGFNDGHMYIGFGDALVVPERWPGFIASYADGAMVVRHVAPGRSQPALGARLVDCDGRNANTLLAELVAPWRGGWDLVANRERQGWRVFYDQGNPWVQRPTTCRFDSAGKVTSVTLNWQPQPKDFATLVSSANASGRAPIAVRDFAGGTWISAGSFHAGEGTPAEKALPALVAEVKAGQQQARSVPILVLDLRGNTGGSSDWGAQLARLLWGDAAVDRVGDAQGKTTHVDWRASPANLAAISDFCGPLIAKGAGDGSSAEALAWCQSSVAGLRSALAARQPLWRGPDDLPVPPKPATPGFTPRTLPTYLLVDSACGSACLDTVDLWRGLGATVIGRTTSADSNYMEVRAQPLPSGLGEFSVPMKVYSGRMRGNNEPVEPKVRYSGSMGDTAALEAWVMTLPR